MALDRRRRGEMGFSLIEILVSLSLLGILSGVFAVGLTTSSKSILIIDERAAAESLARSQMEYIKHQGYSANPWNYGVSSSQRNSSQAPSWWDEENPPLLPGSYTGYSIEANAEEFDTDGDGITEIPGDDEGMHKVTVAVYHLSTDRELVTLEDYIVDR